MSGGDATPPDNIRCGEPSSQGGRRVRMIGVSSGHELRHAIQRSGNRNGDQRADNAQGDTANGNDDDDRERVQVLRPSHDEWLQDVPVG